MGGPFAELVERQGARLFAFLRAVTAGEQAAAGLFGETFRLMAKERVDLEHDADAEVMLYRYALRVMKRFEVPPPDPRSMLSRIFEGVPAEDRLAFVMLEGSGLAIDRAANALRRPEPPLKDALAQALVSITQAADPAFEPAADDATSDAMVAMAAFRWSTREDLARVAADPSAAPRRAAMEHMLAAMRELLPPCDPPEALLRVVDAAVEKSLQSAPEFAPAPQRRSAPRVIAMAVGAVLALGGGGFAFVHLRTDAGEAPTVVEETTDAPSEPAPARRVAPIEPPPGIEVAAQGPPPTDPRLEKATAHARKHRCKKAAHLFAKLVEEAPTNAAAAKAALAPCRGWLKKHRRDPKLAGLVR